jgi:N-acetylglucosamine malate deacetylase 1
MNILIVGPHPDDQELGMGGTAALLAAQGHNVLLLDITDGEPTPFGSPEIRAREAAEAARLLSPPNPHNPIRRYQLGLPNRRVEHTLEARHAVAAVIRAHQSHIIFVPYPQDAHPDHRAVTRIVEDARFDAKLSKLDLPTPPNFPANSPPNPKSQIQNPKSPSPHPTSDIPHPTSPIYPKWLFHYWATHLRISPAPSFIIDISAHWEAKLASIRAYRSQFEANPANRAVIDWIQASAVYFGSRIGTPMGEPFFAQEPIGLSGFAELV